MPGDFVGSRAWVLWSVVVALGCGGVSRVRASGPATNDGSAGAGGDDIVAGVGCNCATSRSLVPLACEDGGLYGRAYASDDGAVVVFQPCNDDACGTRMARWTAAEGTQITDLLIPVAISADGGTVLAGGTSASYVVTSDGNQTVLPFLAGFLSADGRTVVGSQLDDDKITRQTLRWTSAGGTTLDFEDENPFALVAMSRDASVLAGAYWSSTSATPTGAEPFVWSEGEMALLGALPGAGAPSVPDGGVYALSDDGSVAAGSIRVANDAYSLFRYTESTGMITIGPCYSPDMACFRDPFGSGLVLSADGSVLAGTLGEPRENAGKAFRYTVTDSVVLLASSAVTRVSGMSADGSVILGATLDVDNRPVAPFVWDVAHGARLLAEELADAGTDLEGWTLEDAAALSRDGRVAFGTGTCGGVPAIFRAVLPE